LELGGWYKNPVWKETTGPWGGRSQAGSWCAVAARHQSTYALLRLGSGPVTRARAQTTGPMRQCRLVGLGVGAGGVRGDEGELEPRGIRTGSAGRARLCCAVAWPAPGGDPR